MKFINPCLQFCFLFFLIEILDHLTIIIPRTFSWRFLISSSLSYFSVFFLLFHLCYSLLPFSFCGVWCHLLFAVKRVVAALASGVCPLVGEVLGFFFLFFLYFGFLGPHPQNMEIPRLGGQIRTVAVGLHHSNSDLGSKPSL